MIILKLQNTVFPSKQISFGNQIEHLISNSLYISSIFNNTDEVLSMVNSPYLGKSKKIFSACQFLNQFSFCVELSSGRVNNQCNN